MADKYETTTGVAGLATIVMPVQVRAQSHQLVQLVDMTFNQWLRSLSLGVRL
jgi:hypothetical protein